MHGPMNIKYKEIIHVSAETSQQRANLIAMLKRPSL